MLHQDQLLVDHYAVHKINKVEYPLPQNIVAVQLSNQMTGEQSTRNLRWDEQVTTDEPFEVEIGDTGKITIELAQFADDAGSPASGTTSSDCSAILPEKATGSAGPAAKATTLHHVLHVFVSSTDSKMCGVTARSGCRRDA